LAEVAELVDLPSAFIIGPGAGSSRVVGKNCEVRRYIMNDLSTNMILISHDDVTMALLLLMAAFSDHACLFGFCSANECSSLSL